MRQDSALSRQWWRDVAAVAFLAAVTVAAFWKILLTSDYSLLAGQDGAIQWYPWYRFAAEWVRKGVLPLWDPYVFGGHTFIGEAQAGVFYPLNLLQAFLVPGDRPLAPSDIYWMAAFHGFLAAVSMYAFARVLGMGRGAAVMAAVVYAFAGYVASSVRAFISIYYGLAWLPLVLALFRLAVRKRQALLAVAAGLALGMVALVGHLLPPVYGSLILSAYAVYLALAAWRGRRPRRECLWPLAMALVVGSVAVGVAAVQVLPSLEYEPLALKWSGIDSSPLRGDERAPYWLAGGHLQFQPRNVLSFLVPSLFAPEEIGAYLGILPLILALVGAVGRRAYGARFFAVLGLAAFLFSLGDLSVVHGVLWLTVPLLDKARGAVRGLYVVSFAVAVLAGMGTQTLLEGGNRVARLIERVRQAGAHGLGLLVLLGLAMSVIGAARKPPADLDSFYLFLTMAGLAWLTIRLWRGWRLAPRAWYAVVLALVLFDVLSYSTSSIRLIRDFDGRRNLAPEMYYRETGAVRFLRQQPGYFRVDNWNKVLPPNFGDVWQVFGVMGHGNTMPEDYYNLRSLAWFPPSRLYDMLNIRYIVTTDTLKTLPLVYDGNVAAGDLKVYENPSALPRAWLVHRTRQAEVGRATWEAMLAPGFDPAEEAIMAVSLSLPGGAGGTARITEYTLHAIAIEVDTPTDALLVTSENYYPGWVVRIDGQLGPLLRVNGALRGARVPAGRHDVIFSYEPRSFRLGAVISAITVLAGCLLMVSALWRRVRGRVTR